MELGMIDMIRDIWMQVGPDPDRDWSWRRVQLTEVSPDPLVEDVVLGPGHQWYHFVIVPDDTPIPAEAKPAWQPRRPPSSPTTFELPNHHGPLITLP